MEPPIQGLNLRSMVLLLAMSFSRMLWWGKRDWGKRASRSWILGTDKVGRRKPQRQGPEHSHVGESGGIWGSKS